MHQLDITIQHNPGTGLPANVHNQINAYVLAYVGKQVRIRISPPERSSAANKYYWAGVNAPIIEALRASGNEGYTGQMLHDDAKQAFVEPSIINRPDGSTKRVYTTKNLDKPAFMRFTDSIKNLEWIKQLGVHFESVDEYQDRTQQRFKSWGIE
jgi:hypothetical protein